MPPNAADEVRTTKAEIGDRVARATRLADAAVASAPDSPSAARVRLDALRLAGQQDVARSLVAKVIAQASQPETAYVLAALDLAETEPLWTTVLDRLRLAAEGEGSAGRARAALVYSLAKSGDASGARAELAKLDALARPYPLSPDLHALVDRAPSKIGPRCRGRDDVARTAPAAPGAGPAQAAPGASPVPASPPPAVVARRRGRRDPRRLARGHAARVAGLQEGGLRSRTADLRSDRDAQPDRLEAVAALGDVARAEGDTSGAIASYKRAIAVNPSYLPALLGLADTQWASGDRSAATHGYGDIVDRFPEGTYPGYGKQRVEAASAPPAAPAEPAKAPPSPASTDESP